MKVKDKKIYLPLLGAKVFSIPDKKTTVNGIINMLKDLFP